MYKKTLATALLVCSVPALASASWFLSTQAKSAGGTITTTVNGVQSTVNVLNGPVFTPYTTASSVPLTVAASTGYTIASVTVNGKIIPSPASPYTYVFGGSKTTDKSVSAVFVANSLPVTATIPGGTVTPSSVGNVTYNYTLKYPLTFTFSPKAGYTITAINGVPGQSAAVTGSKAVSGTNPGWSVPNAVNAKATVTFPVGYTFTSGVSLSVDGTQMVSTTPVLSHINPSTKTLGSTVNLTASGANLTGLSYKWTYVSGPANQVSYAKDANGKVTTTVTPGPVLTLNNDTTATASFTAPTAASAVINNVTYSNIGQYKFLVGVYKDLDAKGNPVFLSTTLATVNVVSTKKDAAVNQCQFCHTANNIGAIYNTNGTIATTSKSRIFDNWSGSIHGAHGILCSSCHAGTATGGHPGTLACTPCHATTVPGNVGNERTCQHCHTADANTHDVKPTDSPLALHPSCISCHDIAAPAHQGNVNDNNGVRAVVGEFSKWSHHVTGTTLNDAHCAACHLEGQVSADGSAIEVNASVHMVDNQIHLRNVKDDTEIVWNPSSATPNHSGMDTFCMTCHSQNGAVSTGSQAIQNFINTKNLAAPGKTASALNPFGDTISNRYDKMQRPRVTDVDDQFNTGNNSHHGVKGKRYSGRTRSGATRQITSASTFANNSSATLQGIRSTIYDAGNFNSLYVPLGTDGTAATGLGDDSTLHCGDCHTVGQWAPGVTTNAAGQLNTVAIGAHGSNNEYMLRNSIGTDERHTQNAYVTDGNNVVTPTNPNGAFLVCYNCHSYSKYGSTFIGTGADAGNAAGSEMNNPQPHAGEYASGGRCNGAGNTIPFAGYTTGTATDGSQFASRFEGPVTAADAANGFQNPDFGNVFGIQCLNCHNSGIGNAYGGIHGSYNNTTWNDTNGVNHAPDASVTGGAYIDGAGNTQKVERFLPGLGNVMHVPGTLGGVDGTTTFQKNGHISNDTNWEQKQWKQTATTVINYKNAAVSGGQVAAGAGCYTLGVGVADGLKGPSVDGGATATSATEAWGGCEDHNATQGNGNHGFLKRIVRPITY